MMSKALSAWNALFSVRTALAGLWVTLGLSLAPGTSAHAGPLSGKTYVVEVSSSQSSSGYAEFLLPPLLAELDRSDLGPSKGPDADVVVNIVTEADVGRWIGTGSGREWIYTVRITVGVSPASTNLPLDGTPVYGVTAVLRTPDSDRMDELACLTRLAARTALRNYRPTGLFQTDGQSCLRR